MSKKKNKKQKKKNWQKNQTDIFQRQNADSQQVHEKMLQFSSVQFSSSVVSDSLRPHELQHARPPCPSPTPGVHPDSCPASQ